MNSKSLQIGAILAVLATSLLFLAVIFGAINAEQMRTTLAKIVLVIGVVVLTSIAVGFIANIGKK